VSLSDFSALLVVPVDEGLELCFDGVGSGVAEGTVELSGAAFEVATDVFDATCEYNNAIVRG
jgi:phage-related minor tail protein